MIRGLNPETKATILEKFSPFPIPELDHPMMSRVSLWDKEKGHLRLEKKAGGSRERKAFTELGFVEYVLIAASDQQVKFLGRRDAHHDPVDLADLKVDIFGQGDNRFHSHLGYSYGEPSYGNVVRVARIRDKYLGVSLGYDDGITYKAFIGMGESPNIDDFLAGRVSGIQLDLFKLKDYLKTKPSDSVVAEVELIDNQTDERTLTPIDIKKGVIELALNMGDSDIVSPIRVTWDGFVDWEHLSRMMLSPIPSWVETIDLVGIKIKP